MEDPGTHAFGLEQPDDRPYWCIVERLAEGADRGGNLIEGQVLGEPDRGVLGGFNRCQHRADPSRREYDLDIGRFISVDPLVDYSDPQQMHGYAYANNNPATSADPTGQMTDSTGGGGGGGSAPTGGCGSTDNGEAEHRHDEHANPPTAAAQIQSQINAARASHEATKQRVIAVAKSIVKIVADEVGITAGLDCLTGGDIGACAETAVVILSSFAGGVAGKLLAKYGAPWKWKAGAALVKRLWKLVDTGIDAIRGWIKSSGELSKAEHAFATAGKGDGGLVGRLRSMNWGDDTGAISWGRGGQKLSPDAAAEGAHSTFRRGSDGRITHYIRVDSERQESTRLRYC